MQHGYVRDIKFEGHDLSDYSGLEWGNTLSFGSTFTGKSSESPIRSGALGAVSFELHTVIRPIRTGALATMPFPLHTDLRSGSLGIVLLLFVSAQKQFRS
jgi:hypothetical protein